MPPTVVIQTLPNERPRGSWRRASNWAVRHRRAGVAEHGADQHQPVARRIRRAARISRLQNCAELAFDARGEGIIVCGLNTLCAAAHAQSIGRTRLSGDIHLTARGVDGERPD